MKKLVIFSALFVLMITVSSAAAANCGGTIACSCGDTLNESRVLNSSDTLTGCPANGLTISQNHTVLDCAGYSISNSTGTANGHGISLDTGVLNVTVKNCMVGGFLNGLQASYNGHGSTIYNNTFYNNYNFGVFWQVTSGATFINNNISSNRFSGMRVDSCFLSGTKILMADGSQKNIEDVREGDIIMSYSEKTGTNSPGRVKRTFYHERTEGYMIINGGLMLTPNHPMYVNGEWKAAGDISVGDMLLGADGKAVPVNTIGYSDEAVPTYNLEVSGYHNYYANSMLAHNKCPRIFTYNGEEYEFDMLINVAQFGEENSRLYSYPAKHMAEPKILMEYEPSEINYVDFIKVRVTDRAVQPGLLDRVYLLDPVSCVSESGCDLSALEGRDKVYLVLDEERPEYYIEFEAIPELQEGYERAIEMVSDGYQIRVADPEYITVPVYVKEFMREYVETGRLNSYHVISGNVIQYNGYGSTTDNFGIRFINAESHCTVTGNDISYNGRGIYFGSSINMTVEGNNITNNSGNGLYLDTVGSGISVSRNNIHSNLGAQVNSTVSIELSVGGQGNYWGRSCPTRLFIPGTDSNSTSVADSYAYGAADGWLSGQPGCCGAVLTVSATLDQDITGCSGNGLNISSPDVTLDCNGHTISGTGSGNGVEISYADRATVSDCVIHTFSYSGVKASFSRNVNITGNTIYNITDANSDVISVVGNSTLFGGANVTGNNITGGDSGVACSYATIDIIGNDIQGQRYGIEKSIYSGTSKIIGNRISGCTQAGAFLSSASHNVTGNNITGNNYGIWSSGSPKIYHNNIYSNTVNIFSVALEVSFNSQGNYWGHSSCPVFTAGTDSNAQDVVDSYPYSSIDGWLAGSPTDCTYPTWNQTPSNQAVELGSGFSYQVNASDNVAVSAYFIDDTTNFQVNPSTGVITNKTGLSLGAYPLNVSVNDTSNNIISVIITVTVQDTVAPSFTHSFANHTVSYGQGFSYDVNATDLQAITYSVDDTTNFDVNSTTGVVTNKTVLSWGSTYTLTVTARDASSNPVSSSFTVTINSVVSGSVTGNVSKEFECYGASTNVTLYLDTGVTSTITVASSTGAGSPSGLNTLKVRNYTVDSSTSGSLNWALIKIFYSDSDLTSANIDESTLKIYFYNETSASWQLEPDQGVDTASNYIWANVTHFSIFGAYGTAPPAAPAAPEEEGVPSGGGCSINWSCGDWSACYQNGTRERACTNLGSCNLADKVESEACTYIATCFDSLLNGDESDVDCGGSCGKCPDGKACATDEDCSGSCQDGTCYTPSAPEAPAEQPEVTPPEVPAAPPADYGLAVMAIVIAAVVIVAIYLAFFMK